MTGLFGKIGRKAAFYSRRAANLVRERRRMSWVPDDERLFGLLTPEARRRYGSIANILPAWESRLRDALFPGIGAPGFRELFEERFPEERRRIVDAASGIRRNKLTLFRSFEADLGGEIDWHAAIAREGRWPAKYFREIEIRDSHATGDLRTTWELNRHYHWLTLAKAWFLTGDESYYDAFQGQFDGWTRSNPFLVGVNWLSAMEVAVRLNHWLSAHILFCGCRKYDGKARSKFFGWVYLHIHYLMHHLTSEDRGFRNNHLVVEAASLYLATLVFPELAVSSSQNRKCRNILSDELRNQFLPDGFHEELCSSYFLQMAEAYLVCAVAAGRSGAGVPRDWKEGIPKILDALTGIAGPDGKLPPIGDGDDGTFLNLDSNREYLQVKTVADVASASMDCGGVASFGPRIGEGAFWLLGPGADSGGKTVGPETNRIVDRIFGDAQIAVHKESLDGGGEYLLFTAGTRKHERNNGHRHADLLSVVLGHMGRDVFIDPGTYCYNGPLEWRRYFQSTRSHNTVTVDGLDQFLFKGHFGIECINYESSIAMWRGDGVTVFRGEYEDAARGVRHCRRVFLLLPGHILIRDSVSGGKQLRARLNFTLAPGVRIRGKEGLPECPCDLECGYDGGDAFGISIFSGNHSFGDMGRLSTGWCSGSYMVKTECPSITMDSEGRLNLFSTVLRFARGGAFGRDFETGNGTSRESFRFVDGARTVTVEFTDPEPMGSGDPRNGSSCVAHIDNGTGQEPGRYDDGSGRISRTAAGT